VFMNLLRVKNNFAICLVLGILLMGCTPNKYSEYYEKTSNEWMVYLSEISDKQEWSLNNTVLLVLKSSECTPALSELKRWDTLQTNSDTVKVKLIILERYESTFNTFLDFQKITIPAYRDSQSVITSHKLLPHTPMKVLIGKNGKVIKLGAINSRGNEMAFLSQLKN